MKVEPLYLGNDTTVEWSGNTISFLHGTGIEKYEMLIEPEMITELTRWLEQVEMAWIES